MFHEERRKHISSLLFLKRERGKSVFFLSLVFMEREFSQRESFHKEKNKTFFFFNSSSFWVVLKLPETAHLISPIYWVGLSQPTWAPKPNSNTVISIKTNIFIFDSTQDKKKNMIKLRQLFLCLMVNLELSESESLPSNPKLGTDLENLIAL